MCCTFEHHIILRANKGKKGPCVNALSKNSNKFEYIYEEVKTEITLHIYNKPKNRKPSKLLIQGGSQSLICLFVFSELPRIYTGVAKMKPVEAVTKRRQTAKSLVSCEQCKVKATLPDMRNQHKSNLSQERSRLKSLMIPIIKQRCFYVITVDTKQKKGRY